ncbi:MAG TPA: helicase C-terminal domain-containing protein [Thermoanaerobaculia bacterium]|jgi:DNA excision repair protein ERCC-2|nr:helicase C-terminal domain-containing protein [Thermoanaerobaculia bacterium]
MAPRFNSESLTLDLSVADLLDAPMLRSLGFSSRGGYERLWLGQAIHGRYQEQKLKEDPSYRREVVISHTFDHRGWRVTVQGRADGIRKEPDGTLIVEEIKSVRRGGALPPHVRESYQRQALLYAWMLSRAEASPAVRAELVLIAIGSDETERESLDPHFEALEASVRQRVNRILGAWEAAQKRSAERREAAERLVFPYRETRPGQELILAAVETAVANQEHLLLQATTGIGKTVAALYPALRYALANDKRLFVLTAKNTQQEMATAVLALLNQDRAFRSLRLRAKAKMCANDQILCHEEYCRFAKDYGLKLVTSGVLAQIYDTHAAIEPDDVYRAAQAAEVCPFEVSLELSNRVQVTVCDYNYVFDPYVSLTAFGPGEDLSDVILVIDEVHNLVDRGRGYYSPELSSNDARRAGEVVGRWGEPIHFRIETLCLKLAALIDGLVADALEEGPPGDRAVEWPLPEDRFWRLRSELDVAFVDYLEHQRETRTFRAEDPFVELYFNFLRFLNGLMVSDSAFSHVVEYRRGDGRIKILCKDPSRFLGGVINRAHSAVGLSATLSPPEFYTGLLGFATGRTAFVEIANPFPVENRRVVIDPSVATTFRARPMNYDRIAERLAGFADAVPGNCLALFPSYAFLSEITGRMRLHNKRILIQRQADNEKERDLLLQALRSAVFGDILLVAVAGGVFAEGVDYPGEVLKAVAVVGPCLPAMTLEQQLLKDYYEERFEKGFEYSFVVPGMTRVVQAAGRLIRSPEDTGVIALFDQRFLHAPYRDYLPADWLPEEGAGALVGNPSKVAEEFFRALSLRR